MSDERPADTASESLPPELERQIQAAIARGRAVAHCRIVEGGEGALLVWASGEFTGDLGAPRLNQRVAMHAEKLLRREAGGGRKEFDTPDGSLLVETTIHHHPDPNDGS